MISTRSEQNTSQPSRRVRYAVPSAVSAIRVFLAVLLVAGIGRWQKEVFIAAFFVVPLIITLDAVDGILARRLNSQSLLGSFVDIVADRLVEFLFLQHFIRAGLVPLWFVLIFYGRIVLTDLCRMRAFRMERVSATGILLPRPWRYLVLSKLSRSGYAALKGIMFSVLLLVMYRGSNQLSFLGFWIMLAVLAFSALRAIPILITYIPRGNDVVSANLNSDKWLEGDGIAARTTRVAPWVQLAADICLAIVLVVLYQY